MTGNANARPSTPTALSRARLTRSVALALVAVWSGALTLSASPVSAATPSTPYDTVTVEAPDAQATGRWGERIVMANDINGDGANEYFVATPSLTVGGLNNSGRVYLMSGRTHAVLYHIDSPEPQANAQFGFYISVFGDVNGDGRLDIAVGTQVQDVGANTDQGKAWVFSGRDGSLLYALNSPDPQADGRFGERIGAAGDVTGDGIGDVIVGATRHDIPAGCGVGVETAAALAEGCYRNIGQAYIFNGANGNLERELNVPDVDRLALGDRCFEDCGSFGIAVQSPGDTNANGVNDQLVGAAGYAGVGRMYVFEGATGSLRLRIDSPQPEEGQFFGFQDAAPLSPGDVNRDGRADLYGNGFLADGPAGGGQGRGWIFSGTNGALIRQLDDPTPTPGGQFGWSVAVTDFNKDGVPDQYVGQAPHHVAGTDQSGGTYVFDGRDGSVLKIFEVPGGGDNPRLGWGLAAAGDLNGDGEPDYLGGAPFADVGDNSDQGRVYAFLSRVAAASPPPSPAPGPGPGPGPDAAGKFTAKLALARATINRRDRVLDVLAPITSRASGRVRVELHAAGRKFRFTAPIDSAEGRIRFRQPIPAAQARLGTGIITIRYLGDGDTRPQTVRLRAAFRPAVLRLQRPQIVNGRVRASGTVSKLARGVVRLQLEYEHAGGDTAVLRFRAQIRNGRWSLNEQLSETARLGLAQRRGTLHSYTLFTGYFQARMRGEMRSFQVLPDR